jgi:hypothetical protein
MNHKGRTNGNEGVLEQADEKNIWIYEGRSRRFWKIT